MKKSLNMSDSGETGITLIETIVALAIFAITVVVFLSGVINSTAMSDRVDERESAKNLAESAMEWAKNAEYSYNATSYSIGPIPDSDLFPGYSVNLTAEPLHTPDDGIQKLNVTVSYNGTGVLSLQSYKADR